MPLVGHDDAVRRGPLEGQQQRADMRPGGEHSPLRQLAGQRDRLGQAEFRAGEDRDGVAEPVAGMIGQQRAHCVPLPLSRPGGLPEQPIGPRGQLAQLRRILRHPQVQRQQRESRRAYAQQFVDIRAGKHRPTVGKRRPRPVISEINVPVHMAHGARAERRQGGS